MNLLVRGDARRIPLADKSVHMCVTSPPYFGLRDYGTATWVDGDPGCDHSQTRIASPKMADANIIPVNKGDCRKCGARRVDSQIGLEPSPAEFVAALVGVFREVWRVLRDDGVIFVNLGDSYNSQAQHNNGRSSTLTGGKDGVYRETTEDKKWPGCRPLVVGFKPKDRMGIPHRVVFALQADGWYWRDEIVWCLSGGVRVYARTQKGEMPMTIKDLVRLRPETVQLWNGLKWTQVLGWNASPDRGEPLELVLRSGERIGCTVGHVWPTQRGNVRADELKIGDVLQTCRLPQPEWPRSPSGLDDEMVGWFIGLYIAEGSMDSTGTIQIAGHVKEDKRLVKLGRIAEAFDGHCRIYRDGGNSCTIQLDSPILRGILEAYVGGRIASDKHLKVRAWQRSDAFLKAIIEGYLSGDGHWDTLNERWRIGFCNNDALAADLRTLCARLGYSLRLKRTMHMMGDRKFPGYRGQIRTRVSSHHNNRNDGEIVAIGQSRARKFWDIGVADEPHLFALASGVLTHNSKPNPMPESVTDRTTKAHEFIFMLSKQERYWYDQEAIKEAATCAGAPTERKTAGMMARLSQGGLMRTTPVGRTCGSPDNRNRRSVWSIASESFPGAHFATFPRKLIEPCILAGCPKDTCSGCGAPWVRVTERTGMVLKRSERTHDRGHTRSSGTMLEPPTSRTIGFEPTCSCNLPSIPGVAFDPFNGSGTTGVVALAHGRRYVGLDLSADYLAMAQRRIERPHAKIATTRAEEPLPLFS